MSVYRDKKSGCYIFEFDARINGQRIRARKKLPKAWNKTKAEEYAREEKGKLFDQARGGKSHIYTIDDAVSKYFDYRCPELKSGNEAMKEISLLAWAFNGKLLSELDAVCREIVRDGRLEKEDRKPLANGTPRNRIRYLSAACRYAWKHHGMGDSDPAAKVHVPSVSNERQIYATRAEMLRIARRCRHRVVRATIRIAFYSGMRRTEVMRAVPRGEVFTLLTTKNGEPRHIPIHPKVRSALWIYPIKISKGTIHNYWAEARDSLGLNHLHFHDLRHSTASEMINSEIDLYTVGAVLGHKDARSTKRYAHLATKTLAAAVGRIGRRKVA